MKNVCFTRGCEKREKEMVTNTYWKLDPRLLFVCLKQWYWFGVGWSIGGTINQSH